MLWTKVASALGGLMNMLLLANLVNRKCCKNAEKYLKPRNMGTHLRVLSESFPMNSNMT